MKEESDKKLEGRTKVHNVCFYNLTPRIISSLAYSKNFSKLALGRNDGSIEIWNMQYLPFKEKTIFTSDTSLEAIAWLGLRLFAVGLRGELVEWDTKKLIKKHSQLATGSAIWCLDIRPDGNELAIGTEEGYINIFNISDDQMLYKNLFDKQEGRVLCCKYHPKEDFLVTGSIGAIRIWCTRTGHAVQRMTLGRKEKNLETIIWSLRVLCDFTIIAGDSRGVITVWDGRKSAQTEQHPVLKADVLAIDINEEENLLICSGIDPVIRIYAKTEIKREDVVLNRWVKYLQRSAHDHDVKTLVCAEDKIISGGVDGYLTVSSLEKSHQSIAKYGPFLWGKCASIANDNRLLLLKYSNYLEVWRLGCASAKPPIHINELNADDNNMSDKRSRLLCSLESGPAKLLEMKSKHEEIIICSAISPNGNFLIYSTQNDIRLFRFVPGAKGQVSQLKRVKHLPEQFTPATNVIFDETSTRMFLVKSDNIIDVFAILSDDVIDFFVSIKANKFVKEPIHLIEISKCGTYLVAAGTCRTISVWIKHEDNHHFRHHINVPRYTAPVTAIALQSQSPRLVATFSDGKIFEYDMEEMCFTCTDFFKPENHCITGILLDARNPNIILVHNETNLFVLDKHQEDQDEDGTSSSKKSKSLLDRKVLGLSLKLTKSYEQHLIRLLSLDKTGELVLVGVNPSSLIDQLPDAFRVKKFGMM